MRWEQTRRGRSVRAGRARGGEGGRSFRAGRGEDFVFLRKDSFLPRARRRRAPRTLRGARHTHQCGAARARHAHPHATTGCWIQRPPRACWRSRAVAPSSARGCSSRDRAAATRARRVASCGRRLDHTRTHATHTILRVTMLRVAIRRAALGHARRAREVHLVALQPPRNRRVTVVFSRRT